jgi:hypothetical protein
MSNRGAAAGDRRGAAYVTTLMQEPDAESVARLSALGDQDPARAAMELRLLRRSLGLLIAGRDSLDDRTASVVGSALTVAMEADAATPASERARTVSQFNVRLRLYRDLMGSRGSGRTPVAQLGEALVGFAGGRPGHADASLATELVASELDRCNDALRDAFGAADLPSDIAPSHLPIQQR